MTCTLFDMPYIMLAVCATTYALSLCSQEYFKCNYHMIDGRIKIKYKALFAFVICYSIFSVYIGHYVFVSMTFGFGAIMVFLGHCSQFDNNSKHLLMKERRNLYSSMEDERIFDDWLLLETDNEFSSSSWKIIFIFLNISLVGLMSLVCFNFNIVENPSVEIFGTVLAITDVVFNKLGMLICIILFFVMFFWRNFVELQTRRNILKCIVEARDLKKKFLST